MTPGKKYKYIAFYDLDHTILVDNSATHLINEARSRGIMSEKHFRHAVWLSILYKMGIGDSSKMIIRMLSWLKGLREELIIQLCIEVFNEKIVHKIRPEILATIEEHRSQKGAVVLLSSASKPICEPASMHLGLDDMICSQLETNAGVLTGQTVGNLVYGEEKKNRLLSYCSDYGYDPSEAFYYGDSYTDHHVMATVGNPVAVDPDKKLCKIALANHWPILIRDRA
jgi:putative phosphoserine phosphatase/1-acylglycerol-3-phosphate O-acyltransferase